MEPTKTIVKNGYEFTLIDRTGERANTPHPDPCYMGIAGYALKSCKKIKDELQAKR